MNKNDFCQHVYQMKLKGKEPVQIEQALWHHLTLFNKFEDDKEILFIKKNMIQLELFY